MTRCTACNKPINRSKEGYASSTQIDYIKAGKTGSRPVKKSNTNYFHIECRDKYILTKEQMLDNWENGYFSDRADYEEEVN